jgi:hypothetical protein
VPTEKGRAYHVCIRIPQKLVFDGTVSFSVLRKLELSAATTKMGPSLETKLTAKGARMKTTLIWLIVAAVLVIGFLVYRFRSAKNLDVDPYARQEIEKAKRR